MPELAIRRSSPLSRLEAREGPSPVALGSPAALLGSDRAGGLSIAPHQTLPEPPGNHTDGLPGRTGTHISIVTDYLASVKKVDGSQSQHIIQIPKQEEAWPSLPSGLGDVPTGT